ncbi:NADH-ubiquinone oxidoreductase subunit [Grosmannia clavigera kw1407]|uniref:NADH-ubiquinone oxidoreductase subunit n=1 Tax=Grosmannia clavigera (strain kw1407 / UAMH 11150) TaxID=655863 RepID=F0XN71_GROCL|nr:NADH-ubiquinone oxidoreductase subunit [Grosmannia clavigera kw1407]EFX00879.1 NADH-ubiquinone oxidoreductase subunit [Grosmannia clavigera kw1407]
MAGDDVYHPEDAIKASAKGSLVVGGAGLFLAAIQNSLQKRNVGAWGVFTRSGGMVASFAAVGGVYEFSRVAMANLREKKDVYNTAVSGFLAGSVFGLASGRIPRIVGMGAFTASILAAFEFTGGTLRGWSDEKVDDGYSYKEYLRKNRRRPAEETFAELGDGRAGMIHSPDYEALRVQRIKERYGIDVKTVSADPNA